MTQDKSFRRATMFGVLGALVFMVAGVLLCALIPSLQGFVLFHTHDLKFDLVVVALLVRINLFVIIGFITGWAFFLLRGGSPAKKS